ncbi:hypothetical protein BS78_02G099500 [Paspalum vaginatum]|nr:hypothetical protein BS78_02G099500 [Paspalum vaginatum]
MAAEPVKIGLIGGRRGRPKDIDVNEMPGYLINIEIWSSADGSGTGGVISGIRFTYKDNHGIEHTVPSEDGCWGTMDGNYNKFTVQHDDYVNKIEGSVGKAPDQDLVISSLKVDTYKGETSGTFGDPANGSAFTVPLKNAGIGAFFAAAESYLNAVGFYACPLN